MKNYTGSALQEMELDEIEIDLGCHLIEKGTELEKFSDNIQKQFIVYTLESDQYEKLSAKLRSKYETRISKAYDNAYRILLDPIEMHSDGNVYQYGKHIGHIE